MLIELKTYFLKHENHKMNNIQETIEDNLFSFGFLPLLLVMKIYQDKEKYELCSIILKVLNEHSQKYKFKIPARYNADAIEEMKYNFMKHHNLSGNITEYNHAWYAAKIITEIIVTVIISFGEKEDGASSLFG